MSFKAIADAARGHLPKSTAHWMVRNFPAREDQVRAFVAACGATPSETLLWITAFARAQSRQRTSATPRANDAYDAADRLEAAGDDLASRGQYLEAIRLLKQAIQLLRT